MKDPDIRTRGKLSITSSKNMTFDGYGDHLVESKFVNVAVESTPSESSPVIN